jgi:hypothetical protein
MVLVCNGRTYSTADMRVFFTNDPAVPFIYLTRDGRCTFVIERDPGGALEAHRAGTAEIIALSRRYEIPALLGAFPAVFAGAEILPDMNDADDDASVSGRILQSGAGVPPGVGG